MRRIILTLAALSASFAFAEDVTFQGVFNDIANAIISKDGGSGMMPSQMAGRIASIPSGDVWVKPSNWPDIRAILAADKASANPHGLQNDNRIILLVYCSTNVVFTAKSTVYYEEGATYAGNGNVKTSGKTFSYSEDGYHWMIVFGDNGGRVGVMSPLNTFSNYLLWAVGDDEKTNYAYGDYSTFPTQINACRRIDNIILSGSYRINCGYAQCLTGHVTVQWIITDGALYGNVFSEAYCVTRVDGYVSVAGGDVRNNNWNMFTKMYNVEKLPEYIVIPKVSASSCKFEEMYALRSLPKVISPNTETATAMTYSFANSQLLSKDSVAKFSNGTIVDGFAAFLPVPSGHPLAGWTSDATGAAGSRTFVLPSSVRASFTPSEQQAIETAFNAHNWSLAW